jgi:hypothetical protein
MLKPKVSQAVEDAPPWATEDEREVAMQRIYEQALRGSAEYDSRANGAGLKPARAGEHRGAELFPSRRARLRGERQQRCKCLAAYA